MRRLLPLTLLALLLAAAFVAPEAGAGAVAGPCSSSGLVIRVGEEPGGGAAGSNYSRIEFTNLSGRACTLLGVPKVSAVDLRGRRIGAVSKTEPGTKAKPVTLRPDETAVATLRIVDALAFPKARCEPTYAAGLRIGVPGGSGAKVAPFAFMTCASASSRTLAVTPVTTVAASD